jgi:integrase
MAGSAKILASDDLCRLLALTAHGRYPERNAVMVLLSFKAGLRACEIAGLEWPMLLRPSGMVGDQMSLGASITKGKRRRTLPINPELKSALTKLWKAGGRPPSGPVIMSERGGRMTAKTVVNWFADIYAAAGLEGCSSHSGRRTFITNAARLLAKTGGSLRDIQELAGHAALSTTERYIEGDRAIQHQLVSLI